jgi:hypothetical protein
LEAESGRVTGNATRQANIGKQRNSNGRRSLISIIVPVPVIEFGHYHCIAVVIVIAIAIVASSPA